MCGIVGLFLKDPGLRSELGIHFRTMLVGMSERGPDSAGIAIYQAAFSDGRGKLTLFNADPAYPWAGVGDALAAALGAAVDVRVKANHAVMVVDGGEERARAWLAANHPEVRVMGYGHVMEVYKDMGRPADVVAKYGVAEMEGTHAVGHTRMATESEVTTEPIRTPSPPAADLCLVHNGSLSNHNRLRQVAAPQAEWSSETDNDTEVAAGYFAYAHELGNGVHHRGGPGGGPCSALDGFYTFAVGTRDGFSVLRDPFACKHGGPRRDRRLGRHGDGVPHPSPGCRVPRIGGPSGNRCRPSRLQLEPWSAPR